MVGPNPSGSRIAVVDDSELILKVFSSLMRQYHYPADLFRDPVEAVDYILAKPARYRLLILDIQMPKMDGIHFAKVIRSVLPDIPILFMTGGASEETKQSAIALGNVDFLEKPFSLPDVLKKFGIQ